MNTIRKIALLALAGMVAFAAEAGATSNLTKDRRSAKSSVIPGTWHASLSKCKAYAKEHGVPLIAVWSNGDVCGHCVNFETSVVKSEFTQWMKSSGCVFLFVHSGDSDGQQGAAPYKFCNGDGKAGLNQFPFVRVWWYTNNGKTKKKDISVVGDTVDGGRGGATGAKNAVKWFKNQIKGFSPTPAVVVPKYTGGVFEYGDVEGNRLEAEIDVTESVEVPIIRTNATVVASVSTNTLDIVYPDGATVSKTFYWAANEAETNMVVDIAGKSLTTIGEQVTLILKNAAGAGVATSHVTMVASLPNVPSNPYWVGEKTADTLEFGEWTMDLDTAMAKVRSHNQSLSGSGSLSYSSVAPKAYTMLLLEGALWCPDCMNTDANLLETQEFKDWAQEHNVALVAIDLPSDTAGKGSLLTSIPGKNGKTGVSYMSRKSVAAADAADVLERNWEIAQELRIPNWVNPNRPPVPSFFVIRDDGSVAARHQFFGNVQSPTTKDDLEAHLKRFSEMLAQTDDLCEESNDNVYWTEETIGSRETIGGDGSKTLSFSDASDVYRLDPEQTLGKRLVFSLEGDENVSVKLELVQKVNETTTKTLASAEGILCDTVSVGLGDVIPSTNCYLFVSYKKDDKGFPVDDKFSPANPNSSLVAYTVSSDFVVEPTEIAADNTIELTDGVNEVTVSLVSNQLYRITNLDASDADNLAVLTPAAGTVEDLYLSTVDGDKRLVLTGASTSIQKWNPGKVGFFAQRASVAESAVSYDIRVVRSGGESGRATATLSFLDAQTRYPDLVDLSEFQYDFVWEEGDSEVKEAKVILVENTFADGDQAVLFGAETGGDAEPGITEFTLVVRDNDKATPGKIAIVGATPAMAKQMTVVARRGDEVVISLERVSGATGAQSVSLATSSGTLDVTQFNWENRISAAQEARLTLPDGASTSKVKVTMTPAKGSVVDANRRILEVNLVDADAPGFVTDSATIDAYRYVPVQETRIALDGNATDETKVKLFSGALPAGLKWKFDAAAKELVITGIPTKAGASTAVFRAYTGSTAGLTVAVTVDVVDPVKAGAGTATAPLPLNAALAKSHTVQDVMVFSAGDDFEGVLTVTVPATGRASAQFRSAADGTVRMSSTSWDADGVGVDGTFTTTLSGTANGEDYVLKAGISPGGDVVLDFGDRRCALSETSWTRANPATDFKGYYTVNLHGIGSAGTVLARGDGYLTLKMNTTAAINVGKFEYAGILPNGKAVSGSAVLSVANWIEAGNDKFWERGLLPLVFSTSDDSLFGALQINPGAWDPSATNMWDSATGMSTGRCYYKTIRRSVRPAAEAPVTWVHTGKTDEATGATTGGSVVFDANGGYYVATENFAGCCKSSVGTASLKLFLLDGVNAVPEGVMERLESGDVATGKWGNTAVTVKSTAANKAKTKWTNALVSGNTKVLSLSFTPSTGILSGSFTVDGVKMTYKGVVLPGWGSQDCTACSPSAGTGGLEAQLRPFASGAAWFTDSFEYTSGGKVREASERRSCEFSIGVTAGQ